MGMDSDGSNESAGSGGSTDIGNMEPRVTSEIASFHNKIFSKSLHMPDRHISNLLVIYYKTD